MFTSYSKDTKKRPSPRIFVLAFQREIPDRNPTVVAGLRK